MLRFEMDVTAADLAARTIEGVLVPYDEVGTIQGREYRFLPGSVELARSRTPLLVDHDRARPVGVLGELVDVGTAAVARFRVDETQDGDTALVQAASGSRGALSVGAEVVVSRENGGVIDVVKAHVIEASLLALGAFAGATVLRVAAEADEPEPGTGTDDAGAGDDATVVAPGQQELELEDDEDAEDGEHDDDDDAADGAAAPTPEEGTMTAAAAAPVIIAAGADRPVRPLIAGELVALIIRAQHGEPDAHRFLAAALTESISTDLAGVLPPQYERDVLGGKLVPRVLYETFRSRPLPGVGLAVNKPVWTTPPEGAWADSIDADATTSKVVVGSQAANVERWDWAGAIPWVVVQRSDPSIIDEIYAAAVIDFYEDVEHKINAQLAAAAVSPANTLGGGIAAFYVQAGRNPDLAIVSPDVWGEMADAKELDHSVGGGDVSTANGLRSTFAGLTIVASGELPADTRYLATKRAVDARITEPVRLTANAIGALNVELAVVGEGLFDTDYPNELMALTPGAARSSSSSSSRSRSS